MRKGCLARQREGREDTGEGEREERKGGGRRDEGGTSWRGMKTREGKGRLSKNRNENPSHKLFNSKSTPKKYVHAQILC